MIGEVNIQFNTETGEYELKFQNISHPGQGIEYKTLYEVIRRVIGQVDEYVGKNSSEVQGQIVRGDN